MAIIMSIQDLGIEGKWSIMEARQAGILARQGETIIEIEGENFRRITSKQIYERKMTLNASSSPKTIDLLITNEPGRGELMLGIYEISGDKLSICHSQPGRPRPQVFSSNRENGHVLSISQKVVGTLLL